MFEAAQHANMVLGQITRAFHFRNRITFIQLYKQYVQPGICIPGLLERVLKRAVKMVSGLKGRTYEERSVS